jgi:fumarylacetoacetase
MINETHDPALTSWVESANVSGCDFPIQNLPLGVYRRHSQPFSQIGAAIGDSILDLSPWLEERTLDGYLKLPRSQRRDLRQALSKALRKGAAFQEVVPQAECGMLLPASMGDYTDFYASIHHAANVGSMFRPGNPLLPNYKHVPIAYHGRASSIVPSGTPVQRPQGQTGAGLFGPSKNLDYELEIGALLGPGNQQGKPIPIAAAEEHIAGLCLVNDWSARDIQRWESQPLGPFLAKNFATSISPWLVTLEALEPFRVDAPRHETPTLPYLQTGSQTAFDVTVEAWLRSARMTGPVRLSRGSFREMYWTLAQMIAHHTSNGCPIRAGDLIASGTISGPEKTERGCLLELTWNGSEPLHLPSGETRTYLEDGDEIILNGYCQRKGFARIGFGTCRAVISPARI